MVSGPEIRTDKVQQIKTQLENGSYQIRPGEIAGKMIDEII
jgi:flagellar biosynthesis anti-sigma factor FlgM